MSKKIKMIIGSTLVLIIVAVVSAVLLGYVFIGVKSPGQEVSLRYRVCGPEMIETFSSLSFPLNTQGTDTLNSLASKIQANPNSTEDPTCQTIRFFHAFYSNDIDTMRDSVQKLDDMARKGQFVDPDLKNAYTLDVIRSMMHG